MATEPNSSGVKSVFMKVLFVIGVIFLLFILGFGLLIIVPRIVGGLGNVAGGISSFFNRGTNNIYVEVSDSSVSSDEEFVITWEDKKSTSATSYALSFDCVEKVSVFLEKKRIACGSATDISFSDNLLNIIMQSSSANDFVDVEFTITAIEDKSEVRSGSTFVTISNRSLVTPDKPSTSTPDERPTTDNGTVTRNPVATPSYTAPIYTGRDLGLSGIEIGTYTNGIFNSGATNYSRALPAIRFTVTNMGNSPTGPWNFTYNHPSDQNNPGNSGTQPSIDAGHSFQYVVTFDGHSSGYREVRVTLDPNNIVSEFNEANNSAVTTFYFDDSVGGSGGSTGQYSGDADLTVRITGTGRLNGDRFTETNNIDSNDRVAVRFVVKNEGGRTAEDWRYTVKIKGDDTRSYTSSRQKDLGNGESIEFVVGFDDLDDDAEEIEFEVEVDSDDDVDEKSERNNKDSVDVELDN